jgi:hypothetical protein
MKTHNKAIVESRAHNLLYLQNRCYTLQAPSVFSFFTPLHSPPGQFSRSLLLSPEAMALSLKTVVGTHNGVTALI